MYQFSFLSHKLDFLCHQKVWILDEIEEDTLKLSIISSNCDLQHKYVLRSMGAEQRWETLKEVERKLSMIDEMQGSDTIKRNMGRWKKLKI